MPTALVTGATGLVGSHIVERLQADGWSVRALVRKPAAWLTSSGADCVRGDVLDADSFTSASRGVDVIFHNAATITDSGDWEMYRRMNVGGTTNAIEAAAASGARLVQMSSVAVYGGEARFRGPGAVTDEETPLQPLPEREYYARSKRESEALVMDAHASGRIWASAMRPDIIYGRRDRQCVPRIVTVLRLGVAPLIDGGRAILPIVHAANVADGAVRAASTDAAGGRVYNLANDYDVSMREFFELGAEGLGRRVRFVNVPSRLAKRVLAGVAGVVRAATFGRVRLVGAGAFEIFTEDNPFTSERARRELGWSPVVHPRDGVPEAFRWWKTHH